MSMQQSLRRSLVVTGATGKQGGALISALLAHNSQPFDIYAVTRSKASGSAQSLASKPNVKIVEGDFDKPEAVFQQVKNVWGVFIMTTPMGKGGAKKEEVQGKAMVQAALDAGAKHIVFTSVDRGSNGDTEPTNIPHFVSKKNIEDDIMSKTKGKDTTWTILRTVAFMDNMSNDLMGRVFTAMWKQNGDTKLQMISSKDIGRVAAEAFLKADSQDYKNKSISIAGDELSSNEAAKTFKDVTGQDMPYAYSFLGSLAKWMMSDELGKMFAWFVTTGFAADVDGVKRKYPFMKDFRAWLEEESAWRKT